METRILQPVNRPINIFSKMSYSESNRAWNTIRFKKEIINEMPFLKERTSKFLYNLVFFRTHEELERAIRKMKREKAPLPLLVFLHKVKQS